MTMTSKKKELATRKERGLTFQDVRRLSFRPICRRVEQWASSASLEFRFWGRTRLLFGNGGVLDRRRWLPGRRRPERPPRAAFGTGGGDWDEVEFQLRFQATEVGAGERVRNDRGKGTSEQALVPQQAEKAEGVLPEDRFRPPGEAGHVEGWDGDGTVVPGSGD